MGCGEGGLGCTRGDILRRPRVALAAHLVKHDGADMRLGRLPHAIYPSALADQASLPPADILPSSSESARTFSGVEVDLDGGVTTGVEDLRAHRTSARLHWSFTLRHTWRAWTLVTDMMGYGNGTRREMTLRRSTFGRST